MIKFFRKIRQNLLNEGKTSKYFKYAIGEIVLVVIGILIALQINNWNEKRKTNKQLQGYLNSISKNIQSDTIEINQIKSLRMRHNQAAKDYMTCMLIDSTSLELLQRLPPIFGEQYLNVNQSGFEALKSSGYIANLQGSEIEDAIFNYYTLFEKIHESETSLNNFIESMESGLYDADYKDISSFFKLKLPNNSEKDIELTLKLIFQNSKMLGVMQRVADEEYFSTYDDLKTNGYKILKMIEKNRND